MRNCIKKILLLFNIISYFNLITSQTTDENDMMTSNLSLNYSDEIMASNIIINHTNSYSNETSASSKIDTSEHTTTTLTFEIITATTTNPTTTSHSGCNYVRSIKVIFLLLTLNLF